MVKNIFFKKKLFSPLRSVATLWYNVLANPEKGERKTITKNNHEENHDGKQDGQA